VEDLAAEHVAEPAEDPGVEQHLGDGGVGIVVGPQQLDAAIEVGVGPGEVGPEAAQPRVAGGVGAAVRLDEGGVEADGAPAVDLDERPQVVMRALPAVAIAVEVPRAAHPHVRVQDDAVVPFDLEVLAVALDGLDQPAGTGRDPDELGRLEADHLLVDQRRPQRGSRPVDGVALRHRPFTVGRPLRPVADASTPGNSLPERPSCGRPGKELANPATAARRRGPGRGGSSGRGRRSSGRAPTR
jgi:hypothetical protein